jgi:large-conductance mechanosensitive channel
LTDGGAVRYGIGGWECQMSWGNIVSSLVVFMIVVVLFLLLIRALERWPQL